MNILLIGDLHSPVMCKKSLRCFYGAIMRMHKLKPFTHVIQLGDGYELSCVSRYPKSMNMSTPADEIYAARKQLEDFWHNIRKICKNSQLVMIKGNHCVRFEKKIVERIPELADLIDFNHLWHFDGVKTIDDVREEFELKCGKNKVVFMHGYRSKIGDHMTHNLENTACGHLHRLGVVYKRHKNKILFEVNAACLADLESRPLSYTPQKKYFSHMNGFAVIDEFGARCIPIINGKLWTES